MARKNSIIPFDPNDGLDYRLENLLMRAVRRPVEKPPLRFGEQFEENERFVEQMMADIQQVADDRDHQAAERAARKEELAWLRKGHRTLTELRSLLRDPQKLAAEASRQARTSPG